MEPLRRILIAAEHASARFGGEAALPLHYFRILSELGLEVWLVVHERTRDELERLVPELRDHIRYVRDTWLHKALWRIGAHLPTAAQTILQVMSRIHTQYVARQHIRRLIQAHRIQVVHQPIPVSPKTPSLLVGLGVPLVLGPLNGGMGYPPAFRGGAERLSSVIVRLAREASHVLHLALRGTLEATTILVANARTRAALPRGVRGKVTTLVENGVDLRLFSAEARGALRGVGPDAALRAIYVGRLVSLKALDLVLEALAAPEAAAVSLTVVGDGPMLAPWKQTADELGLGSRVEFRGFCAQIEVASLLARSDVMVLPSLHECGGAVVLESMATGVPVIAVNWGGPADYIRPGTGWLLEPSSRLDLVRGFADLLGGLHRDRTLLRRTGEAAASEVRSRFDWRIKVRSMLTVYDEARMRFRRVGGYRAGGS